MLYVTLYPHIQYICYFIILQYTMCSHIVNIGAMSPTVMRITLGAAVA